MTLFDRSLQVIEIGDIESLVARGISESDTVEFKEDLPSKGKDPWHSGNAVSERARNKLLEELIAFANSLGGWLVLGMAESQDSPPRAFNICPLPRCSDLAMRLEQAAGALIEPQVPSLRFQGIPIDDDGNGVVVAQVQRSHLAPHRLKPTKECDTRRGERTETMTMREIRDLVLTTRDLTDHLESQFEDRKESFNQECSKCTAEAVQSIRVSAVPLDPDRIYIDAQKQFSGPGEQLQQAAATFSDGKPTNVKALLPRSYISWRPMLRGISGSNDYEEFTIQVEIFNNGVANFTSHFSDSESANRIYPSWFTGAVLAALLFADRIRNAVNETGVEYAVEVEFHSRGPEFVMLMDWEDNMQPRLHPARFTSDKFLFPRYRFGTHIDDVLHYFVRDMWNCTGCAADTEDLTWNVTTG